MKGKSILSTIAIIVISLVANNLAATPRWSASTPQVGEANNEVSVLEKIRQDSQTCKMLEVKILQRPLKLSGEAGAQLIPELVHVQAFAFYYGTDIVYDSWGVENKNGKVAFAKETINGYDKNQVLGRYIISTDNYDYSKNAAEQLLREADYEFTNTIDWKQNLKDGVSAGKEAGDDIGNHEGKIAGLVFSLATGIPGGMVLGKYGSKVTGMAGGAVASIVYTLKQYRKNSHNAKVENNDKKQVCYLGLNCHYGIEVLVNFSALSPSFASLSPYRYPGELEELKRREEGGEEGTAMQPDLHTLNLDDPNGDWCKCDPPGCKEKTTGQVRYVQCQCAKCGKVNVEYARRALAMEKEVNAQGGQTQWWGNRSDAVKAANTQK